MDKITLDKLQKVAALMDRAGTEGEAEAAAAAMSRLLIKYNLTESEVRQAQGKSTSPDIVVKYHSLGKDRSRGLTWKLGLLNISAKMNLCEMVRIGETHGNAWLVGAEANIQATLFMYDHLAVVFQRIGRETYDNLDQWSQLQCGRAKFVYNFMIGVPQGLYLKMRADRKAQIQENPKINAVVLVNDDAVQRKIHEHIGATHTENQPILSDTLGYDAGVAAGLRYNDAKPVADHNHLALNG